MLIYYSNTPFHLGYTDSHFQSDRDKNKSNSDYVFILGGTTVVLRSVKHKYIADSTTKSQYVAAFKAAKEIV